MATARPQALRYICATILLCTGALASALPPAQWVQYYTCPVANKTGASSPSRRTLWQSLLRNRCDLNPESWRWKYVDELEPAFTPLVSERSLDERLANIIDVVDSIKPYSLKSHKFRSADQEVNKQLVAGKRVDDQLCGFHLRQMLKQIDAFSASLSAKRASRSQPAAHLDDEQLRLARVLDSFGRYESGFLSGRVYSLGDYQQCIASQLLLSDGANRSQLVPTRYCYAQFDMHQHLAESLALRKRPSFEPTDQLINSAICIPESCHSKSFDEHAELFRELARRQFRMPPTIYVDEEPHLASVFCVVDDDSEHMRWSWASILLVVFLAGFGALTIVATLQHPRASNGNDYDHNLDKHQNTNNHHTQLPIQVQAAEKRTWLRLFDLVDSWNEFIGTAGKAGAANARDSLVNLGPLYGLKTLCMQVVVAGHGFTTISHASNHLHLLASAETSPYILNLLTAVFVVDAFFVMSGLLVVVTRLRRLQRLFRAQTQDNTTTTWDFQRSLGQFLAVWKTVGLIRYVQMVPLYFLVHRFTQSIFLHLGTGPLWDYGLNNSTLVGACLRESWTVPFTLAQSSLPTTRTCVPPAWSIVSDLSAFLVVLPPVIYLLATNRVALAYFVSLSVGVYSLARFWLDRFNQLTPEQFYEMNDMRLFSFIREAQEASHYYTLALYRMSRFLLGAFLGHRLVCYNQSSANKEPAPRSILGKHARLITWSAAIGLVAIHLSFGTMLRSRKALGDYHVLINSVSMLLGPLVWSFLFAALLCRLLVDWRNSAAARFLSHPFFKSVSRLNYSILLIHGLFYFYNSSVMTDLYHFSTWYTATNFLSVYSLSLILATLVHVVIETPLHKLSARLVSG